MRGRNGGVAPGRKAFRDRDLGTGIARDRQIEGMGAIPLSTVVSKRLVKALLERSVSIELANYAAGTAGDGFSLFPDFMSAIDSHLVAWHLG